MPALEKLSIDTPEQVALEFSLATVGSRFLAVATDTLIQIGGAATLLFAASTMAWAARFTIDGTTPWLLAGVILGLFILYYGYFAVFEAVWDGQTPGKRLIGLRVIHASGRPVSAFEAILRNIVRVADQLPGIYAIGIVVVFLTERSQRLGDLAAGTVVVHERIGAEDSRESAVPGAIAGPTTQHGASRLTAEEIALIELFFRRRGQLDDYGRERAARRIADRIRERLQITAEVDSERLLGEVLAEYKARGRFR